MNLDLHVTAEYLPILDHWVARVPILPGVVGEGHDRAGAVQNAVASALQEVGAMVGAGCLLPEALYRLLYTETGETVSNCDVSIWVEEKQ